MRNKVKSFKSKEAVFIEILPFDTASFAIYNYQTKLLLPG